MVEQYSVLFWLMLEGKCPCWGAASYPTIRDNVSRARSPATFRGFSLSVALF